MMIIHEENFRPLSIGELQAKSLQSRIRDNVGHVGHFQQRV